MTFVLVRRCTFPLNSSSFSSQTMAKKKGPRRPPAQKKPPLTHFLCLPFVTPESRPQLESSLKAFREDVAPVNPKASSQVDRSTENIQTGQELVLPVIHPKSIRHVGALHCTLGVMSLDRDKLVEAIEFLHGLDIRAVIQDSADSPSKQTQNASRNGGSSDLASLERPITPPSVERTVGPFKVRLKGLLSMHAPQKTSILYSAPDDETGRLYPFCVALQKLFKEKGFLVEDNRELKLHATVVNTIYAKGRNRPEKGQPRLHSSTAGAIQSSGHGHEANAPLKIDATAILEKYKEYVWANDIVLDRVAICEMGAKKTFDEVANVTDEEYTEVASIALPS